MDRETRAVLEQAERALGHNLQWIHDKVNLEVRQEQPETLLRLRELSQAWIDCCKALA